METEKGGLLHACQKRENPPPVCRVKQLWFVRVSGVLALAVGATRLALARTSGGARDVCRGCHSHSLESSSQTSSCALDCDDGIGGASVFYAIKSSSQPKFIQRAADIISTWGQWAPGRIVLFSDDKNMNLTHRLQNVFPNVCVETVPNVSRFDDYHHHRRRKVPGMQAQRNKTLYVIEYFLARRQEHHLCYFDDDLYVHVPNLELELSQMSKHSKTSMIADVIVSQGKLNNGTLYANNGWCMTREFAEEAMQTIDKFGDEWTRNDDVGFGRFLAKHSLNMHDSRFWRGQYRHHGEDLGNLADVCRMSMWHVACADNILRKSMLQYSWHKLVVSENCTWRSSCKGVCPPLDQVALEGLSE